MESQNRKIKSQIVQNYFSNYFVYLVAGLEQFLLYPEPFVNVSKLVVDIKFEDIHRFGGVAKSFADISGWFVKLPESIEKLPKTPQNALNMCRTSIKRKNNESTIP